jgi:hypothetical protein
MEIVESEHVEQSMWDAFWEQQRRLIRGQRVTPLFLDDPEISEDTPQLPTKPVSGLRLNLKAVPHLAKWND